MTQCFTRPPLVVARNQARCQNLVESTKLERITIDLKKTHRKEKKERRKQKKESKREKSHKAKQFPTSKKVSDEIDQHEKSGLTEELEKPQSNNHGYLSDGSHNSKKRKIDDSPQVIESCVKAAPVSGNPLRIRFVFKKPKTEVTVLPSENLVSSTSVANSVSCSKISEPEEILQTTSVVATTIEIKKRRKHKPSKEDQYNALFDDWTPLPLCFADDSSSKDDDEWLFGNKTQVKLSSEGKSIKINEDTNMSLRIHGDSCWPKAQFLSEVGIYSLPYTVPF